MSRRDELQEILNFGVLTDDDISEFMELESEARMKLTKKWKLEYGQHWFYMGDLDYFKYDIVQQVPALWFPYKSQAKEFEKQFKTTIKLAGIEKAFPEKYDKEIAKKHLMFVKPGITQESHCGERYNEKRWKKHWKEKPGFGECYFMEDNSKILEIFNELKSKWKLEGKLPIGRLEQFMYK